MSSCLTAKTPRCPSYREISLGIKPNRSRRVVSARFHFHNFSPTGEGNNGAVWSINGICSMPSESNSFSPRATGDFGTACCVVARGVKMAASVAAIVLLFLSGIQYSVQESLAPPSDLDVAKWSPESVLLGWNFTLPGNLNMNAITFHIEYSTSGGDSRNVQLSGSYGLRVNLTNLVKSTEYSVKITATSDGLESSGAATASFTTLAEDYPMPQLMSNTLISTKSLPRYELRWKLGRNDFLVGFEVISCLEICKSVFKPRSDPPDSTYSFEYELEAFFMEYNITVTAIYSQPLDIRVRRSLIHKTLSEAGEPSVVTNLRKVSQIGPVVHLKWDKASIPNGPVSHYRLFIDDVIDGFTEMELKTTVNEINVTLPTPASNFYRVRITAVNLDQRAEAMRSKTTQALIPYEPPEPPAKIESVALGSSAVSFRVVPATDFAGAFYDVRVPSKGWNYSTPELVTFSGLQPYETVFFTAATCYRESRNEKRCGPPLSSSITSAVAGPDKVNDLKIVIPEDETANVTWSTPRRPNGPLDGYIISIIGPGSSDDVISNTTVPPFKHAFALETDECSESCRIRVAAYNLDLVTKELVIGESTELLYRPYTRIPSIVAGSIMMFFVVGAVLGGFLYKEKYAAKKPKIDEEGNVEETTTITENTQQE